MREVEKLEIKTHVFCVEGEITREDIVLVMERVCAHGSKTKWWRGRAQTLAYVVRSLGDGLQISWIEDEQRVWCVHGAEVGSGLMLLVWDERMALGEIQIEDNDASEDEKAYGIIQEILR